MALIPKVMLLMVIPWLSVAIAQAAEPAMNADTAAGQHAAIANPGSQNPANGVTAQVNGALLRGESHPNLNTPRLPPASYTHACWLDGYRRLPNDGGQLRLAIETGHYAFCLNPADLTMAGCGPCEGPGYEASLAIPAVRLGSLPSARLDISCEVGGVIYRAWRSEAGEGKMASARLWESGQLVQHYDFLNVRFRDDAGHDLGRYATLDLLAWPDSLTLGILFPEAKGDVTSGRLRIRMTSPVLHGEMKQEIVFGATSSTARGASLTMRLPPGSGAQLPIVVTDALGTSVPVRVDPARDCQVAEVSKLERRFATGYVPLKDYDEFSIAVPNPGTTTAWVRFLLDMRPTANPTGLCPILCQSDGTPTGIPVQLSKNFHMREVGDYLKAYALIPVPSGGASYLLRVVYGFYGTLPAASDAQLSLIGYRGGGFGRWDMLSIGCWGETFCFDPDMSLVDCTITDVRLLMTRLGAPGKSWNWTNAGWGGDWLGLHTEQGQKIPLVDMRSAYLSHGPCLTEVVHAGSYGTNRMATVEARTSTLRTDDYARTFQRLRYVFAARVPAERVWLHKMGGRANHTTTPQVVIGNRDGLQQDLTLPGTATPGTVLVPATDLAGPAPWWIALPGSTFTDDDSRRGQGWRALAIRAYRLRAGGRTWDRPTFAVHARLQKDVGVCADMLLVPPSGLESFAPGDEVEMDLEWFTVPRDAASYYGPNQAFSDHLASHPSSWQTALREVQGNDLRVTAIGGKVLRRYPVEIAADPGVSELSVEIDGGLGFIPVRITGLSQPDGWKMFRQDGGGWQALDQSTHGNDFWQVDAQGPTGWNLTWNLPGDRQGPVLWTLRRP